VDLLRNLAHGDARGSVDADHNVRGEPFLPHDPSRRTARQTQLRARRVVLDLAGRKIVHEAIVAHCAHRDWTLHALSVRSNHVHVIVSCDVRPEVAMAQLKAWSTRRLREGQALGSEDPAWTEKGSRKYLWNTESLRRAIEYVSEYQGERTG